MTKMILAKSEKVGYEPGSFLPLLNYLSLTQRLNLNHTIPSYDSKLKLCVRVPSIFNKNFNTEKI